MKDTLEEIFYEHIMESKKADFENEIHFRSGKNEKNLEMRLNKKEKKLLLRIIDDKDLIQEEISTRRFVEGFKLGLKIGYESNKD